MFMQLRVDQSSNSEVPRRGPGADFTSFFVSRTEMLKGLFQNPDGKKTPLYLSSSHSETVWVRHNRSGFPFEPANWLAHIGHEMDDLHTVQVDFVRHMIKAELVPKLAHRGLPNREERLD